MNGRRRFLAALAGTALPPALTACASAQPATVVLGTPRDMAALATRLPTAGSLLLGEVHDNVAGHEARVAVLEQLARVAVPTALALEHIDQRHQVALDQARAAYPRDPQRWIDGVRAAGGAASWPWPQLRRALDVAVKAGWSVRGTNRTRTELDAVLAAGVASVLDEEGARRLRQAIDEGHCGVLPPAATQRLAGLQQARDHAIVDALVAAHATARRVILLAGNGHVRRDFGVAAYPRLHAAGGVVSVGFVETGDATPADAFDHRVVVAPQARPDPCIGMRERRPG